MNRVETLRKYIDGMLLNMTDDAERRCAYIHLYGVAQSCALIGLKRGENAELAVMAGMLHDLYSYVNMDTNEHARSGALFARAILIFLDITTEEESELICNAIYSHSDKENIHSNFTEVLIDADVMQHCLYNPMLGIKEHERARYENLKCEFGIL